MKAKTKFSIVFFLVLSISISLAISSNFNLNVSNENNHAQYKDKIKSDLGNKIENNPIEKQRVIIKVNEEQKSRIKNKFSDKFNDITDEQILSAELDSDEINNLANDSDVLEIWPDRVTQSFLDQSVYQIHADYAWNLSLNGSGITIAILDTGVAANHPMLNGRVVLQADFTGDGVSDSYGHGTHVAGIAAGDGNYTGVAPGALIYNGKVLDDSGSGYLSWLINGIDWAMDPDGDPLTDDGADIISLSLGATYSGEPEELLNAPEVEKVREAISNGIVVVIASGNCGSGCNGFYGVTTPGITPEAITIGAVNDNNEWASFSGGDTINGNVKPDVVVPGVGICSSVPSGYECMSGTSMATPHVSGAAALLLQKGIESEDVKDTLKQTATDLGEDGEDIKYGAGLVDLSSAINYQPNSSFLPEIKNVMITSGIVGEEIKITAAISNSESTILKINNVTIEEFKDDVDYQFIARKEGIYFIEIISTNEFGSLSYIDNVEVTNYNIIIPSLNLGKTSEIKIIYKNDQKFRNIENKDLDSKALEKVKKKLDKDILVNFYYDEFEFTHFEEKGLKILPGETGEIRFEITPNLVGAYNLHFIINDQKISIQAIVYGQADSMMDSINVWVRG